MPRTDQETLGRSPHASKRRRRGRRGTSLGDRGAGGGPATPRAWRRRLAGAALLALVAAALASCGAAPPAPAAPPATATAAPPATATTASAPPVTAAPVASPTAAPARPPAAPTPTAGRPASPAATPAGAAQAEPWLVEGRPVLQVAVAGERRFFVTTSAGLYALTGDQLERRATGGEWPNLVAAGPATLVSGEPPPCARGGDGVPLRRSVDGGRTWQPARAAGGSGPLAARPVPTLGGDLFAIACDGLYRSTDSGATWQRLAILEPDYEPVDVATTPDGARLYIVALFGEGGTTRLLASERQGNGWAPARRLRESWGGGVVSVGREDGRPVVYFGGPLGVEVSRDGGATWQALNAGLDSTRLLADPRGAALPPAEEAKLRRGAGIYSVAPRLDRPRVLLGGVDGIYLLGNGRWQKLPVLDGQLVREVFFDLDGVAYARSDLGVFRLRGV
jgi:hypothetical protein